MAIYKKESLQLTQFIEKFETLEGDFIIDYFINNKVFVVRFECSSDKTTYVLVSQKNSLRTFSSMSSLVNTFNLEDSTVYTIEFTDENVIPDGL